MPARRASSRVGTSGWSHDHWDGPFYPPGLPASRRLEHYASRLPAVEVNASFYRPPAERTLREWRERVPAGFLFSMKASRWITHMKKLREPAATVPGFLERIAVLGDSLGPVLFQLPPRWRFDAERLEAFLASLSGDFRYAFEFRDESGFNPLARR